MPRRTPLPSHLGDAFSVSAAHSSGVGYGRTRSRDLIAPFHGVRVAVREPRPTLDARARELAAWYSPRLRPGQFFCEASALALHGVELPRAALDSLVHVGVASPRRSPRTRGVVGHEVRDPSVTMMRGVPVCSPAEAWAHCAVRLSTRDLVVIGDGLLRRKHPLMSIDQLAEFVASRRGWRGSRRLTEAFHMVRARSESPRETLLRLHIVAAGLPEPAVNPEVRDDRGRFLGCGDLVYFEQRVIVEYEGWNFHFADEQQVHDDIERVARFTAAGWTVIRVGKFHDCRVILDRIRAALAA